MKNNISVVLSSSLNFRNTGMFSVDYAAYQFFTENFKEYNLKFYVFNLSDKSYYPYESLMPYEIYNEISNENVEEFYDSDLIVCWSDFFHTRHYLEEYFYKYILQNSEDRVTTLELYYKLYFLYYAEDTVFDRTITFGNSMMFLDHSEKTNNDLYARCLRRMYTKIKLTMPRDYVSRKKIQKILKSNCLVGCDPAFLIVNKENVHEKENTIGLFLGRRTAIKLSDVFNVIKFAKQNGMKIEWINWMINRESFFKRAIQNPLQAKNLFLHFMLSVIFKKKKKNLENDFLSLHRYRIIVTDTYHLTVNAINERVPVCCSGNDSIIYGKEELDLHDKKKEILFDMLDLANSYGKITIEKLNNTLIYSETSYHRIRVERIRQTLIEKCNNILEKKR